MAMEMEYLTQVTTVPITHTIDAIKMEEILVRQHQQQQISSRSPLLHLHLLLQQLEPQHKMETVAATVVVVVVLIVVVMVKTAMEMEYLTQVTTVPITHTIDAIKMEEILVRLVQMTSSPLLLLGMETKQVSDGDYRSDVQLTHEPTCYYSLLNNTMMMSL
jgi:hypothetical protein